MLNGQGEPRTFSDTDQEKIVKEVIEPMASNGMRTICIAYKDYVPGECLREECLPDQTPPPLHNCFTALLPGPPG